MLIKQVAIYRHSVLFVLFTLLGWFPRKHRFGAKTLMIWFSNLSAICVCKSFQQEGESTVVFFLSYYSVQPDGSSFAFSLNHTTFDLRERNLTRSVTTGIVDFSLHRLCRPWARSIQPKFPEISVQNSMDRFGPTGKVSKKRVHLLRWSSFPGRTGLNFGWMDRAPYSKYSSIFLKKSTVYGKVLLE